MDNASQKSRTEISSLGEFGLIDRIKNRLNPFYHASTLLGIGDDAAVVEAGNGQVLVVTTDMLLDGVHFDLSYAPLKHVGYKAMVVNFSDVAAMNALPQQVTVGLALSSRFSVEAVDELYAGMALACDHYHVDLVGGDTTSSRSGLVISVTAMGRANRESVVYRSGARKGDILCVTGDLGAAYLGLQLLEREKREFMANPSMQPQLQGFDYLIERQLKPEARTELIHEWKERNIQPTSMIDISDGLASEILHLCKHSNLGAVLFDDKIPIADLTRQVCEEDFKLSSVTAALNGGEDYELLFTIRQEDYDLFKIMPNISFIGYMQPIEEGSWLITSAGQKVPLQAQGWQHF